MAKIYGLNGRVTGKVGNTVFAVDGGIQVARQYNPIVNNPRTAAQQDQRMLVNYAGQMSRGIIPAAIEGLEGNKRQRRSALLSNLIKDAFVNVTAGTKKEVRFLADKVVLSRGAKVLNFNAELESVIAQANGDDAVNVKFSARLEGGVLPAGERVRIVVIGAPADDPTAHDGVVSSVVDVTMPNSANSVRSIVMRNVTGAETRSYAVYVIPLDLVNSNVLSAEYVNGMADQGAFILPLSYVTSSAYLYGRSQYIGMKSTPTA